METSTETSSQFNFDFRGTGSDYFRIWIVNLLLSIITLGIYSAWATVRNRRFFYTHTFLDGHNFDFLGSPIAILRARIVAAILIFIYVFGQNLLPILYTIILLIGLALYPWIMNRAWSFKLRHTEYRNLRFSFKVSDGRAYLIQLPLLIFFAMTIACITYLALTENSPNVNDLSDPQTKVLILLFILSFATMLTYYLTRIATKRFLTRQSAYGDHAFSSEMKILLMLLFLTSSVIIFMFAFLILGFILTSSVYGTDFFSHIDTIMTEPNPSISFIMLGVYIIALQFGMSFYYVMSFNYWINTTSAKEARFHSKLKFWRYTAIQISNFLFILFTFGLFYPYAVVRRYRYIASCLSITADSLDNLSGESQSNASALGDELTDVFGIEIGF